MMPNKTIYVADADLPVFEKAQQLAGDNLSATIAQALKRFVAMQEARESGFQEVTVKVGRVTQAAKRFTGRLLAKGETADRSDLRHERYTVYETTKGKIAVYVKSSPNWNYSGGEEIWEHWGDERSENRLDVYDSVEELKGKIPGELYSVVERALSDDPVEYLDI